MGPHTSLMEAPLSSIGVSVFTSPIQTLHSFTCFSAAVLPLWFALSVGGTMKNASVLVTVYSLPVSLSMSLLHNAETGPVCDCKHSEPVDQSAEIK